MLKTPDLSSEFHPQPKVYKAKKTPKPLNKKGAKTLEWEAARAELKQIFKSHGVTTCELKYPKCWRNTALGFAHVAKRRELGPDEIMSVVLACNSCHLVVENKPHVEMRSILEKIIKERSWQ